MVNILEAGNILYFHRTAISLCGNLIKVCLRYLSRYLKVEAGTQMSGTDWA